MKNKKTKKFWVVLVVSFSLVPLAFVSLLIGVLFLKQDRIVQELITTLNKDFNGHFTLEDSHIAPFENFPYISIDLEDLSVYDSKTIADSTRILCVHDAYIGFDLLQLLSGKIDIKTIKLKEGTINLVQQLDGKLNLLRAFETKEAIEIEDPNEEFHLDLKSIILDHIDINNFNEETKMHLDLYFTKAKASFKTIDNHLSASLETKFELTLISAGDTSFIKHKHFDLYTKIDYSNESQLLTINPSTITLEGAEFNAKGSINLKDDVNLDLVFDGSKPNFDLFIAIAPEELVETLKKYDNEGRVYFNAVVKGKSINGHTPFIEAQFGCEDAFFSNNFTKKKLEDLQFKGYFTNGALCNSSTMEFSLTDFSVKPEAGVFKGDLIVKNFDAPEIDLKLTSDFQLEFLANFFQVTDLKELKGGIKLTMNFRDIIDLQHPEKSIEKLNESYFTELKITDLSFSSPKFHLPLKKLNLYAVMDGHKATIDYFDLLIGNSDLHIKGSISDLPAIIHHTKDQVFTKLSIKSTFLDLFELTDTKKDSTKSFNEQIQNLSLDLSFKSSAQAFTESPNLPVGEFYIDNLYAKLKHYPHTLHDFHADLMVDESDFRILDFKGMIDKSDFHFNGKLVNYDLWFEDAPKGDTKIEFLLDSKTIQLEDLFSYGGENFVPKDYRHEEFKNLTLHGYADIHFSKELKSLDLYLDKFEASAKVHPMRFEKFKGRVHVEDEHLTLEKFSGKVGKSSFTTDLVYYYGKDKELKKKDNKLVFFSPRLDFDELFNYNPPPLSKTLTPEDHEAVFNIYELPFTDMRFDITIDNLNYHRYLVQDFTTRFNTTENHYIYIDTLSTKVAGGGINMKGYFNGSNSKKIYFSPNMSFKNIDLDKLLFKFENFGQDHLVSENLHGKLSGKMTGKIHMHADMVPILDDSEIHLDINVVNGKLENYGPLSAVSDFFKDKNLSKVLFDTLSNRIDMKNGLLEIPAMTINSSLGFIELSGKQDLNANMEYYIRVPLKLVTQAASSKLFGKKPDEIDPEQDDQIVYRNEDKKTRYVNLKVSGNSENFNFSLGKDKKLK